MSDIGNREIFSANLRRLMEEKRVSRNEVCAALGFKYSTFADWVNGAKYPRIDKIEMLANYFGVEKSALIEDSSQSDELAADLQILRDRPDLRALLHVGVKNTPENVRKLADLMASMGGDG